MTGTPVHRLLGGDPGALENAATASLAALEERIGPAEVVCFEPRMQGPQGHFPLLTDAYGRLCADAGLAMNVFHHRDWRTDRPDRWHGAFPVVDHLVGADAPVDPAVLAAFSDLVALIVRSCAGRSGARAALFPTARFLTLPGIAAAIAGVDGLRGAVIGVMETAPVPDCDDAGLVSDAFRSAAVTLSACGKDVLLVAESAAIADWLAGHGFERQSIRVAPYPAAARFEAPFPRQAPTERPRLGALGATRPVHHPERLARYLLEADIGAADWCVRLDPAHAAAPLNVAPDELESALRSRGVTLLPRHLAQPDYDAALAALDAMLLPYGDRYRTIGSGIFLECVCAGVVPLVPAGTTMRSLYETLGGRAPAIETGTPAGIVDAVDACLADLPALRANALGVRRAWLAHEHGPAAWRRDVSALLERACAG
jgi:hypothetical protein